jgi:hypothetical protein
VEEDDGGIASVDRVIDRLLRNSVRDETELLLVLSMDADDTD